MSDPHKARSHTGYVFTFGGTAISWRFRKQTLVATSSNYAEIIALREACRECVWLGSMNQHIQRASGIIIDKEPTKVFEYNVACVTQVKEGYIKSNRTKHIPPRFISYSISVQAITQQIFLQRHSQPQPSRNIFKASECVIYDGIYKEKNMSFPGGATALFFSS